MSIAAKNGYLADFKTGYLQRAIALHKCAVTGGTDVAYDRVAGYAVGRLVKVVAGANDFYIISAPSNVTATSIGEATHIVAQSDDSLRNVPSDAIPVEKYTTRNRNILANTFIPEDLGGGTYSTPLASSIEPWKTVSVYKIINVDDIKIIPVAPTTVSVTR